jgi:hypothetical protein
VAEKTAVQTQDQPQPHIAVTEELGQAHQLAEEKVDSGDQLWNATFETYYDTYLEELTAIEILNLGLG